MTNGVGKNLTATHERLPDNWDLQQNKDPMSIKVQNTNYTFEQNNNKGNKTRASNDAMSTKNGEIGGKLKNSEEINEHTSHENNMKGLNEGDEDSATSGRPTEEKRGDEVEETARKFFEEEFVTLSPEEYTNFLASEDDFNSKVRDSYMRLFNWDRNLLVSLRMLCSKFYLKGESQEIDRVIMSMSQAFVFQHPDNVFQTKDSDKIYVILYSLILLNTALHNQDANKTSRISQGDFVRNTYSTYITQGHKRKQVPIKQRVQIENELGSYYSNISKKSLELKGNTGNQSSATSFRGPHNLEDSRNLLRQGSNISLASQDTGGRSMFNYSWRSTSGASGMTQQTFSGSTTSNTRAGFTRALMSNQGPNSSFGDTASQRFLRNRPSLSQLRSGRDGDSLMKKSSRASLVSRDSVFDDSDFTVSLDQIDMENLDVSDGMSGAPQRQLRDNDDFCVEEFQDQIELTLELGGSPYLKEGLLKAKIVNKDEEETGPFNDKIGLTSSSGNSFRFFSFLGIGSTSLSKRGPDSRNRTLKNKYSDYFVVVSKGELSLYSFNETIVRKERARNNTGKKIQEEEETVGDGNWLNNAATVGKYNLCSTVSRIESSKLSHSVREEVMWSLAFPSTSKKSPKVLYFVAGTKEIALEFVNTCNFWAAKITAVPTLEEGISSVEHGWTNLDKLIEQKEDFRKIKHIEKWEPIPRGVYLSNLVLKDIKDENSLHYGLIKQFLKTLDYYSNLKRVFNDFNQLKLKFIKNFSTKYSHNSNYQKVITNYEKKGSEYANDLKRYQSYLIILSFALQLRFDLKDQRNRDNADSSASNTLDDSLSQDSPDMNKNFELETAAQAEIEKLFRSIKNMEKLVPNYQTSPTTSTIVAEKKKAHMGKDLDAPSFSLVKSPKTFTLANYNGKDSFFGDLHNNSTNSLSHSHSTNTIKEEDEDKENESNFVDLRNHFSDTTDGGNRNIHPSGPGDHDSSHERSYPKKDAYHLITVKISTGTGTAPLSSY